MSNAVPNAQTVSENDNRNRGLMWLPLLSLCAIDAALVSESEMYIFF